MQERHPPKQQTGKMKKRKEKEKEKRKKENTQQVVDIHVFRDLPPSVTMSDNMHLLFPNVSPLCL